MRGYAQATVRDPARERLIVEHYEMARRIAVRVARRAPRNVREDDLVGAALVGLTEASDRFDAGRGEPFVAFAEKRIRGAVLDELRRGDPLSRRDRWAARRVGAMQRQLEQAYGRPAEDEEVAAALGVTIEKYRSDLEALPHCAFVELGEQHAGIDPRPSPADATEVAEARRRVRACLEHLPERDAVLLSLYYVEELTYAEIGEVLGVSESRVCQLHGRALARLRAAWDEAPAASSGG